MSPFVEGVLAGYGIAIPVGAVAILIVNTAIRRGFRIGFVAGAGAATADFLYAVLAAVAGAAVTVALKPLAVPLRLLSGAVLVAIAGWGLWRGLSRPSKASDRADASPPLRMYAQFVGITIINPLTVVYFTAFMIGQGGSLAGAPLASSLLFILGVGLSSLSWQSVLAAFGGVAGRRLSPRFQVLATVLGNLLVLGLAARILVTAFV
jgi:threonine/homoserine/homoserine lactone efflux protein